MLLRLRFRFQNPVKRLFSLLLNTLVIVTQFHSHSLFGILKMGRFLHKQKSLPHSAPPSWRSWDGWTDGQVLLQNFLLNGRMLGCRGHGLFRKNDKWTRRVSAPPKKLFNDSSNQSAFPISRIPPTFSIVNFILKSIKCDYRTCFVIFRDTLCLLLPH